MNNNYKWKRYCDLLFSDDSLGFWLDISRMDVEENDFKNLREDYCKAFDSVERLENGSIANFDEGRQVGHYWLRNPQIAPSQEITDSIANEIQDISKFGSSILNGEITNSYGKKFTDVF